MATISFSNRIKDITGMKYGDLIAVKCMGTGNKNQSIWEFRCKCGNTINEYAYIVKQKHLKNCGCITGKNISGRRFGRLIAMNPSGRRLFGKIYWRCRCDCGKEVEVWTSNLISGHTQSCGCLCMERASIVNKTHGMSGTPEYMRMKARKHKDRYAGIDSKWNIDMERAIRSLFSGCVICGSENDLEIDHVKPKSRGFGLEPGNAVILCGFHNGLSFKGNKMPEELPEYARDQILSASYDFQVYWNRICNGEFGNAP